MALPFGTFRTFAEEHLGFLSRAFTRKLFLLSFCSPIFTFLTERQTQYPFPSSMPLSRDLFSVGELILLFLIFWPCRRETCSVFSGQPRMELVNPFFLPFISYFMIRLNGNPFVTSCRALFPFFSFTIPHGLTKLSPPKIWFSPSLLHLPVVCCLGQLHLVLSPSFLLNKALFNGSDYQKYDSPPKNFLAEHDSTFSLPL